MAEIPPYRATNAQLEAGLRRAHWVFGVGFVSMVIGFVTMIVAVVAQGWEWLFVLAVVMLWGGIALVIYSPRILRNLRIR